MSNPLNLQTARFTRINIHGVEETQVMSVSNLIVDYKSLTAIVSFEGRAHENGIPIEHRLNIPFDLSETPIQQIVGGVSGLIWKNAKEIPFVENFEIVEGNWQPIKKSLTELGATIEDVDLSELMKNAEKRNK